MPPPEAFPAVPYSDITSEEKSKLLCLLASRLEEQKDLIAQKDQQLALKDKQISELLQKVNELLEGQLKTQKSFAEMTALINSQTKTIAELSDQLKRSNRNTYGSKELQKTEASHHRHLS